MKLECLKPLTLLTAVHTFLLCATLVFAADAPAIKITLEHPDQTLRLGDTPTFIGTVTNLGETPLKGVVVYLSLVSLEPGNEHPVDLEDWSAEKAVRIDLLPPGQTSTHQWSMRLIQAGSFGVALTGIGTEEKQPTVSPLVRFYVEPKPGLDSKRVLPVAIGEPLLLLALWGAIRLLGGGIKHPLRVPSE